MNRCIDEKCRSKRIASAKAKCSDSFWWKTSEKSLEGYVETPGGELGYGDYIEFKYCLECGKIQYRFPVPG